MNTIDLVRLIQSTSESEAVIILNKDKIKTAKEVISGIIDGIEFTADSLDELIVDE